MSILSRFNQLQSTKKTGIQHKPFKAMPRPKITPVKTIQEIKKTAKKPYVSPTLTRNNITPKKPKKTKTGKEIKPVYTIQEQNEARRVMDESWHWTHTYTGDPNDVEALRKFNEREMIYQHNPKQYMVDRYQQYAENYKKAMAQAGFSDEIQREMGAWFDAHSGDMTPQMRDALNQLPDIHTAYYISDDNPESSPNLQDEEEVWNWLIDHTEYDEDGNFVRYK